MRANFNLIPSLFVLLITYFSTTSFAQNNVKFSKTDGNIWSDLLKSRSFIKANKNGNNKVLSFTFDDGPDYRTTPFLLYYLDRYNIKATFFINGHRIVPSNDGYEKNIKVLKQIYSKGHNIGTHTFSHKDITILPESNMIWEIDYPFKLLNNLLGIKSFLFRPPFGKLNEIAKNYILEKEYTITLWNIDSEDWISKTPIEIVNKFKAELTEHPEGGIVVFHDTSRITVESFPIIMEWLLQYNYELTAQGLQPYELVGLENFFDQRSNN